MGKSLNRRITPWSLLSFAAPSIIMMVFMSLYTIVDGIFVSRFVGSNALSSLNISRSKCGDRHCHDAGIGWKCDH